MQANRSSSWSLMTLCLRSVVPTVPSISIFKYVSQTHFFLFFFSVSDFQILHAFHSIERILNDFLKRSAVFEVVFWDGKFDTYLLSHNRPNSSAFTRSQTLDHPNEWYPSCI